jgi:sugar lactone lactonase YvrE
VWLALLVGCEPKAPVDPCEVPGNVCTWLGVPGMAAFTAEGKSRAVTTLYLPIDLTFGPDGVAYYADFNNHAIRKVGLDGIVRDISGSGMAGDGNIDGRDCWEGCPGASTTWHGPTHVELDPQDPNVLWVASWANHRIAKVLLDSRKVYYWAGDGQPFSHDDGPREEASFAYPSSVALTADGTAYVADSANHVIRKIATDGTVTTLAGTPRRMGFSGDGGPAGEALLHGALEESRDPSSQLIVDGSRLVFADTKNGTVRELDLDTGKIALIAGRYTSAGTGTFVDAGTGVSFEADLGSKWGYAGDGGPATDAVFADPHDVARGPDGSLYVVDTGNSCVRRITPSGEIEPFAGVCTEQGLAGDGGPAKEALFLRPFGVAVGPDGAVYIADTHNHVIRRVAP